MAALWVMSPLLKFPAIVETLSDTGESKLQDHVTGPLWAENVCIVTVQGPAAVQM